MALYKVAKYTAKTGKFTTCRERLPCSPEFWQRCKMDSQRDRIEVNFLKIPKKKESGYKVTSATVYFPDKDVWVYTLLKE